MTPDLQDILKTHWGYTTFREPQDRIISDVLDGKDCLALLPTGGGKSICYQIPALARPGVCIVVSPLVALMEDQVNQLKRRKIPSAAVHSGMSTDELDRTLDNCVYGNIRLLYCSPERLQTDLFRERVSRMNVNLIAVDEAHCISEWGHDFRPTYLAIGSIRELHPKVPVLALTASATERVCQDIIQQLELKSPVIHRKSFSRPNIAFAVRMVEDREARLQQALSRIPGTAIVYVRSRKVTAEVARRLEKSGIPAAFYHAGLTFEQRRDSQNAWIDGKSRVMVATNAFGMGIDKADVRLVVHLGPPDSLEAYYQEAGRAGRDGQPAYALLLCHPGDFKDLRNRSLASQPDLSFLRNLYQCLANQCQLAEGAGEMISFPLDISAFCNRFKLKPAETRAGFRRLEEAGLVQVDERFYQPSRLRVDISKEDLYAFRVAHEKFDAPLLALLRLYGAEIFSSYISIRESTIAAGTSRSTAEVTSMLRQLHQMRIIRYFESSDQPRLVWLTPRFDAGRIPMDVRKLEERKKILLAKTESMIAYAQNTETCRQVLMLAYFNEKEEASCGTCDHCRSSKQEKKEMSLEDKIVEALGDKTLSPSDLENILPSHEPAKINEAIRKLIEQGLIRYDERWRLRLADHKSG